MESTAVRDLPKILTIVLLMIGCGGGADCVSGPLCGTGSGDPPIITGTISGAVTVGGAGVAGVAVRLSNGSTTTTSTAGTYSFGGVPAGSHTVTISNLPANADCPVTSRTVVISSSSRQATADFACTVLRATIQGTVRADGVGIPGANVTLTGPNSGTTVTDATGEFGFAELNGGSYSVSISDISSVAYSFSETSRTVNVSPGETATVNFDGSRLIPALVEEAPTNISGGLGSETFFVFSYAGAIGGAAGTAARSLRLAGAALTRHNPKGDVGSQILVAGEGSPGLTDALQGTATVGSPVLTFSLTGGIGDADLYVRRGEPPTLDVFDGASTWVVSDERVWGEDLPAGDWFIMIRGFTDYSDVTLQVRTEAGGPWVSVAVGSFHACALDESGSASCWGHNSDGRLGDGAIDNRNTPTRVAGGLTFETLSLGVWHSCGIVSITGAAYCWGDPSFGKLGNGTDTGQVEPTLVSGGLTFIQIASGWHHTCGITASFVTYCWGRNERGELGDGTFTDSFTPVLVKGARSLRTLEAGIRYTCGRDVNGTAYCWGSNEFGQLGDRTRTNRNIPVAVSGGLVFDELAVGGYHACGIVELQLHCWGSNSRGQLGDGSFTDYLVPTSTAGLYTSVVGGVLHTCAGFPGGAVQCWGLGADGQLGSGSFPQNQATPLSVLGGLNLFNFNLGQNHTCGTSAAGAIYCWGLNESGQIGDATLLTRSVPTRLSGS